MSQPPAGARLSLCLIARDEEALLPGCLASVQGVVAEIVVVDTGSADATPRIAREAGALLVEHPWADDFAAARNAALDAATGDWVLVLDADERLAPGAGTALRRALAEDDFDCGLLPLHDADRLDAAPAEVLSGAARRGPPTLLPRLLRKTPDLCYEGVVHEGVGRWLLGRRVRCVDAPIVHYGNVPALREARGKADRNRRLLELRCATQPQDAVAWSYLARERFRADDAEGADEALERGWEALEAALARGERPACLALTTMRAQILLGSRPAKALACLTTCRALGHRHPNLDLVEGRVRYGLALCDPRHRAEHLAAGRAALSAAIEADGQVFVEEQLPGATSWAARTWRGVLALLAGAPRPALADFEAALALDPTWLPARLGQAEALLDLGDPEAALRVLAPLMIRAEPDPWILAARACEALGQLEDQARFLRTARARLEVGFVALHRDTQLREQIQAADLYRGEPRPGDGVTGRVGALVLHVPAETLLAAGVGPRLRIIAKNLLRIGRARDFAALLEPRAEEVLPGCEALMRDLLADLDLDIEDDGEPDFVLIGGAGRSGTTLFRAMLGAHPRLYCGPEVKLIPVVCQLRQDWLRTLGPELAEAGIDEPRLDVAVRAFVRALLENLGAPGQRVAEKTPHNLLHMAYLGRLFPNARFLHILRDGRAVAASLVQQRWLDPHTGAPVWYCADLASAARYWRDLVIAVRQQAPTVPGRYLEVRYEDLVREPEPTLRRVLAFLGERWDPAVLRHHEAGAVLSGRESSSEAVRAAVHGRAVEKWRERVSAQEEAAIVEVAGEVLRGLGYVE